MRIALALPDLGRYRSRFRMIAELSRLTSETLLATNAPPPGFASSEGALRIVSPQRSARKLAFSSFVAATIIRRDSTFDVLHDMFYNMIPAFLLTRSLRRRNARVMSIYASNVEWFRERRFAEYPNPRYNRLRLVNYLLERVELTLVDGVIVVSPHMREVLVASSTFDEDSIRAIPSEVDTDFFRPRPDVGALQVAHADNPRILFVGNVFRLKGIFELIECFASLKKQLPKAELWVAGNPNPYDIGPLLELIRTLSLESSVQIFGYVSQERLVELYSKASVLVLPTRFEGSPRAVKEACACGCPVVASPHPGISSIDPEGNFITLIDPSNPESISEGVLRVVSSEQLRSRLSRLSRDAMIRRFSPGVIAKEIFSFYQDVLSGL